MGPTLGMAQGHAGFTALQLEAPAKSDVEKVETLALAAFLLLVQW